MNPDGQIVRLDAETKVSESLADHKQELRLWLRLLTCTTLIENDIRRRLSARFDITLSRFDLMAQLEKAEDGATMGDISKRMMVSAGNVTGLVERLVASGHIARNADPQDRRVQVIRLTDLGRTEFTRMAAEHEEWVAEIFAGLGPDEMDRLMGLLARLKRSVHAASDEREIP
ncbi:MAG: MarR family winged helix-turn-helix transcriptional regulator [Inquilinaceae bacterium]